jgi:ketosteroid isomerase-like protein
MPGMHPNEELIDRFYKAFARRDHATMAAAYHPDARFSDPVFPDLDHAGVTSMWRMLCERALDLELTHRDVRADDKKGSAHWDADYTFTATKRRVHNSIDATFEFRDGKIIRHYDVFDFWAWSRMALGPAGVVLGWTSIIQNKVRRQAGENLARFREKNA